LLKVPAAQLSQVALPVESAYVPAVHAAQSEASSPPEFGFAVPNGHGVHEVAPVESE
jgi:hypothetical protein